MEALRGSDCFYLMDPLKVAEGGLVNDYGIFSDLSGRLSDCNEWFFVLWIH